MRTVRVRGTTALRLTVASLLVFGIVGPAQDVRADEPRVHAIINARIVPISGPVIQKGIIVVRDGLIEAVGASVAVPPDARILDGNGLTVYPGLIDAGSDIGLEESRPQQTSAARPASGPPGPGLPQQMQQQRASSSPDEPQGLTPFDQTIDQVNPKARKIESARAAGITTTLVVPRRGFFQGQSALVNLAGESAGSMALKTPVAMHVGLSSGPGFGRGYPASLMGVLAFVKQTLMDAQHYGKAWEIYEANPGARRPEYSRALQALQPAIQRRMAVVLPGDTPEEIQRSMDLASSFNLDWILSGAKKAAKIAPLIKEKRIPVLLSVDYPERNRDEDPAFVEEVDDLRDRLEAPKNAGRLAQAGVRFAFQSGTANPRDFMRNVSKAVESGLDPDLALRALTLTAAEILGVSDRIGSIEKGKTANLVLANGDLFESRTQIKFVFVDGQRMVIPEPEAPRGPEGGRPSMPTRERASSAGGDWTVTVDSPQGPVEVTFRLRQNGSEISGTTESRLGVADILEGQIDGASLQFRVNVNTPDGNTLPVTFSGTIQGSDISGSADAGPLGRMSFKGSKKP